MSQDSVRISLDVATQAANAALKSVRILTDEADKSLTIFKGNFAAGIAVNAVVGAFNQLSGFVSTFIDEASGSEVAIQRLNTALQSTGLYTPKASEDLQEFAGALQNTSIYGDEAIMSTQSLLLSLTTLDRDGIKAATQAAVDLAATLDIDLATASDMITKAINGNTTAFKKKGIEIQSADTDAGRLTNTLKALSSQQGAAEAATNTYAGAMAKARNQQSESFESLGKLITQHPIMIAGIKGVSQAFADSATTITENKEELGNLTTTVGITAGVVLAVAGAWKLYALAAGSAIVQTATLNAVAFGTSVTMGVLSAAVKAAWVAITGPIGLIVAGVTLVGVAVYQVVKNWEAVKAGAYEALAATLEFAAKGAAVFSEDKAAILQAQAQGYREQAFFIREAAKAKKELADVPASDVETPEQKAKRAKALADAKKESDAHNNYLATTKRLNKQNLELIEAEGFQALVDLNASYYQAKVEQENGFEIGRQEKFNLANENRLARQQELDRQELELALAADMAKAQAETDAEARKNAVREANDKAALERIKLQTKQELDQAKLKLEGQKKLDDAALVAKTNTLNLFASLSNSKNRELAAIGKAAGLVQIAMATPVAIAESFQFGTQTGGPILGGIFAGVAAAAMAAQAAQLTGLNFANGGIVPGTSFSGDRVKANVNSGEMILNSGQQRNLFDIANGNGQAGSGITASDLANFARQIMSTPIVVSIDGRELIGVFRDQIAGGKSFA